MNNLKSLSNLKLAAIHQFKRSGFLGTSVLAILCGLKYSHVIFNGFCLAQN